MAIFLLSIFNAQQPSSVKNRLSEPIFASFPQGKLLGRSRTIKKACHCEEGGEATRRGNLL